MGWQISAQLLSLVKPLCDEALKRVSRNYVLEPFYCKKRQKSPWLVTGLGNRGPLKVINGTKLILDDHMIHFDSFRICFESFRSFRGTLFPKPVVGHELSFLLGICDKPALPHASRK